jgi:hypothetical protein
MANTSRMTDHQKATMRRILRAQTACRPAAILPEIARQLIRRGLVYHLHNYTRYEWTCPVATLWAVGLTAAGQAFAESLAPKETV